MRCSLFQMTSNTVKSFNSEAVNNDHASGGLAERRANLNRCLTNIQPLKSDRLY